MLIYDQYPYSDSLLPPLEAEIRRQKAEHPGMTLGVAGGLTWSGYKTNWQWPPELNVFFHYIVNKYKIYLSGRTNTALEPHEVWGNIISPGGLLNPHNHAAPGNAWTGVLYLTPAGIRVMDRELTFDPGWFILFRANEMHSVSPVAHERISLAFNMRIIDYGRS